MNVFTKRLVGAMKTLCVEILRAHLHVASVKMATHVMEIHVHVSIECFKLVYSLKIC